MMDDCGEHRQLAYFRSKENAEKEAIKRLSSISDYAREYVYFWVAQYETED